METIFNTSPTPESRERFPSCSLDFVTSEADPFRSRPPPAQRLLSSRRPPPGPGFGAVDGETALRQVTRILLISFPFCPSQLTDGQALLSITEPGPSSQTALKVKRAGSKQSSVVLSSHTRVRLVGNPTRLPELLSVSLHGIPCHSKQPPF
ncbi:unnamed protein product [Rangifer tarandus platyrhynchus]|uniref:Uncharacterized protein n=2 Tax=Rangifer tarandus platyrhynchus TaxID=3082113 RepID=A0ABN8ZJ98_RANTA|nr:unnamed protein product [Rangifer tarandus platyrhynchus]CAI9708350.1 unnamed protein product [Rangifer tarandus platyrhynchus]